MILQNPLLPRLSENHWKSPLSQTPRLLPGAEPDQVCLSPRASQQLQTYPHQLGGVLVLPGLCEKGEHLKGVIDHLSQGGNNQHGGILNARFMKDYPLERIAHMSNAELRQALQLNPEGNLFAMTYTKNDNPIAKNAGEVKWATEVVARLTGDQQVDLVAHSKGGLDARKYLEDPQEKVGKLITIGTPHRGSWLALPEVLTGGIFGKLFLGKDGAGGTQDLMPQWLNDILQRLNDNQGLQESRADIFSIATKGDGVVDLGSAVLNPAKSRVLDKVKHIEQLDSHEVHRVVGELLAA